MPGRIRLSLQRDSDGTGQLFVEASAAGYSGRASAWFDVAQIADFARSLDAYPITPDDPPVLQGGFWAREDGNVLEQCHVSFRVVAADSRGTLAVQLHLETPFWNGDRAGSQQRVDLEILTEYASMHEFSRAVAALAAGVREEAVLESAV